jgi:glyoxylase-like metal-dependent hydrolase (beta-lactamase superfamily II)
MLHTHWHLDHAGGDGELKALAGLGVRQHAVQRQRGTGLRLASPRGTNLLRHRVP